MLLLLLVLLSLQKKSKIWCIHVLVRLLLLLALVVVSGFISPLHFTYFLSIREIHIRVFRASQQHMTQRHSYAYIYKCIRQAKSGYVHHHQQHPSPISRTHMLELNEQRKNGALRFCCYCVRTSLPQCERTFHTDFGP